DAGLGPFAQSRDGLGADAVQAGGHAVRPAAELAPGPHLGEDHFQGRAAGVLVRVDGDAAAVVGHADRPVHVDGDGDVLGEPGQSLVDGVVDELVYEVVQPLRSGVADVHARPLADVGGVTEVLDVLICIRGGPGGRARQN